MMYPSSDALARRRSCGEEDAVEAGSGDHNTRVTSSV
jgi:hypothetical protein